MSQNLDTRQNKKIIVHELYTFCTIYEYYYCRGTHSSPTFLFDELSCSVHFTKTLDTQKHPASLYSCGLAMAATFMAWNLPWKFAPHHLDALPIKEVRQGVVPSTLTNHWDTTLSPFPRGKSLPIIFTMYMHFPRWNLASWQYWLVAKENFKKGYLRPPVTMEIGASFWCPVHLERVKFFCRFKGLNCLNPTHYWMG